MKKLLLLTLILTLFTCSEDSNCDDAPAGTWSGTYQIDSGDSGTFTLVPDYPDGLGYVYHTGSLSSDVYGSMDFNGDIDAQGGTVEGLLTFSARTSDSSPIEYNFKGYVVCNNVVYDGSDGIVTVNGDFGAGTFTATKN